MVLGSAPLKKSPFWSIYTPTFVTVVLPPAVVHEDHTVLATSLPKPFGFPRSYLPGPEPLASGYCAETCMFAAIAARFFPAFLPPKSSAQGPYFSSSFAVSNAASTIGFPPPPPPSPPLYP